MLINSIFSVFLIPDSCPHPLVSFKLEKLFGKGNEYLNVFTPNQAFRVFSESLYSHVIESGTRNYVEFYF